MPNPMPAPAPSYAVTAVPDVELTPAAQPAIDINARLAAMPPAQKAGQVMMIGFDGTSLTPELAAVISELHVGGVVIFERNVGGPDELARLTTDLQAVACSNGDPPLLIAIDQEGGRVARLKAARGFTEFPGAMALAATGDVENARRVARAMAAELLAVGINMNLAPNLDVNNNPDNPVIGIRSFSSDPATVAAFGMAFAEGLQAAGILAVGKHFPGHGDTSVDSHIALPLVPHDRDRLDTVEFVPFKAAISAPSPVATGEGWGGGQGIAGIMSAHVTFPAIDPTSGLAATLSQRVLIGFLRDELGYDGLALTDALDMGALAKSGYAQPVAAVTALAAGADVLVFNHGHELHRQAHTLILERVRGGQLPADRLDVAAGRVLAAKERFGLLEPGGRGQESGVRRQEAGVGPQVGTAEHKALAREIAAQAITLLRDDACLLPLAPEAELLAIEPPAAVGLGKALGATTLSISAHPSTAEIQTAVGMAAEGRTVIVATADARQSPGQARLVLALLAAKAPVVVIAVRGPYDLMAFPDAPTCLASYGANPPTLAALRAVLRGELKPAGRLPVDLPALYPLGAGLGDFVCAERLAG